MSTLLPLAVAANPFAQFGVNWHDFVSQAIAFLIIAWILNKFVFKAVLKSVADRQQAEDEVRENSQRIKDELAAVEISRQEVVQQAKDQADRMIFEAKGQVADLLRREKEHCERVGHEMLEKARAEALLDQARLKTEMRGEIASLVVNLTTKLTQMNLKAADRDRLLESAIQEINGSLEK